MATTLISSEELFGKKNKTGGLIKSSDLFSVAPKEEEEEEEEIIAPEVVFPSGPQSKAPPVQLEDMKVQENNITAMSKTYADLGQSLDTKYEAYTKLTEEIDKLEEDIQTAAPEMQFRLNENRNNLVGQHNILVDDLKVGTKKYQDIFGQLESESKLFNANVNSYNQWQETQPLEEPDPEYIPESDAKDNIDAFRLGMSDIVHKSKQYFFAALPNLIYADVKPEDQKYYKIQGQDYGLTDDQIKKVNEVNKGKREEVSKIYQRSEKRYDQWLVEHPEFVPRPEWSKGVIENVKKDWKILLDPSYWAYEAAQSASFMLGVFGTTYVVSQATGNPFLGMAAGVAVATPSQSQDVWDELVANGATEEQASKIAVPLGVAIASVEVLGDLPLLAAISKPFKKLLFKGIKKEIVKRTALSIAKSGTKTFFAVEGGEIFEENIQGAMQDAAVNVFRENVSLLEKIPETTVKTFMATAPFAIFGGGANVRSNINERLKQKIAENNIKTALEEVVLPKKSEDKMPGDEGYVAPTPETKPKTEPTPKTEKEPEVVTEKDTIKQINDEFNLASKEKRNPVLPEGYEIDDDTGRVMSETGFNGSTQKVLSVTDDNTLEKGKFKIVAVIEPAIYKDGKIVSNAKVLAVKGTKEAVVVEPTPETETPKLVDDRPFAKLLDLDKLANDTYEIRPSKRAEGYFDIFFKSTDKIASKSLQSNMRTAEDTISDRITIKLRKILEGGNTPEEGGEKIKEIYKKYLREETTTATAGVPEAKGITPISLPTIDDMTKNMTPMQKGRVNAVLNEKISKRAGDKYYIGTRAEVLTKFKEDGYTPKIEEVPAIKDVSRTQWNRMNQKEQDDFTKRQQNAGTKKSYIAIKGDSIFDLKKTEYDYLKFIAEPTQATTGKAEPTTEPKAEKPWTISKEKSVVEKTYFGTPPVKFPAIKVEIKGFEDKNIYVYKTHSGWLLGDVNENGAVIKDYVGTKRGVGLIGYPTSEEAITDGVKVLNKGIEVEPTVIPEAERPSPVNLQVFDKVDAVGKSCLSVFSSDKLKELLSDFNKNKTFLEDRYKNADWVENSLNDAILERHQAKQVTPEVTPEETIVDTEQGLPDTAKSENVAFEVLNAEAVRLGRASWEKMTRKEIITILNDKKVFKDPDGKLVKKLGNVGINLWKDENYPMWIGGAEKEHVLTNSHWLFVESTVADKIIADQKRKIIESDIKTFMKDIPASEGMTHEKAVEMAEGGWDKMETGQYPNWKDIVEKTEKVRSKEKVYVQGQIIGGIKDNEALTIMSNGITQVYMNTDYVALMEKYFPDGVWNLAGELEPVSMVQDNKIAAIVMPIRRDPDVARPFDIWDIPGGVKPTAEEIAKKAKDYADEQKAKMDELEGETEYPFLKRPGIKESDSGWATNKVEKKITPEEYEKNKAINEKFVELHKKEVMDQTAKINDKNIGLLIRDSYRNIINGVPILRNANYLLNTVTKENVKGADVKNVPLSILDLIELMMRKQSIYPEQYTNYREAMATLVRVSDQIQGEARVLKSERVAPDEYGDIYIPGMKFSRPRMAVAEQQSLFPGMEAPVTEEVPEELSARTWGQEMEKEAVTPKRINKTEIMTWADKAFGFPIKGKATHRWEAAGVYYPKKQIVRMEKWGELAVAAHEISHGLDDIIEAKVDKRWKNITREIQRELADLDYDQGDNGRRTSEGFAEFMRHRLTIGDEMKLAPAFDKYFDEKILPQFPEMKKNLDLFKEKLDIWNKQGAENRIIQHIDWKGEHTKTRGLLPKVKKALEWVNVRFNDEFYFPQKIVKGIEKVMGKEIRPSKNPAILMEYSKAKAGAIARTFVMKKAIDEHGNVVGPSLLEVLKPIPNKEIRQFIAYGVSKRILNLAGRKIESGFDIDDAKYMVNKYKDKGWDETLKELTNWSNYMLDWIVRAGGLSGEAAQLMRDLNPIYLPFKVAFLEEMSVIKGMSIGYVDTGSGIKAIKGSGRPKINPIEAMITQTRELIAKAQKIRIAKAFIDLANEEGVGGFITKVPAPMKATTFSANQIKGYLDEIATGEEGMTGSGEYNNFLTVFTQDFKYNGKENIVSIWRDGKQEFYEIHPDLYEAFKGVDPLKLGAIAKVFAPYAKMLRLGATGLKLSFGLARNPFRDADTYAVASKRIEATVFDPIKGYYKDITCKPGEATWRFKALGGGLSGQIGLDRASVQNSYDEMLDYKLGALGKILHVAKHPVNTLSDLISITEMGPRSAEMEAAYKKYTSEKWQKSHPDWTEEDAFIQAFIDAQDVTVNFTKSGKWAKQLNQMTAFFNVAIRGPEKLYRSLKERPIQTFVKGTLWLTTIAVASWYKNKDKDWYKNLPPAYKYSNLFFEVNGSVFRLPIPFELGIIFMAAPQAALDTMQDKDSKALEGLLDLAKAQIPNPLPSVFGPAIDVAKNKNYLGVPIESEGMQYLYPTERKRDYTTKLAVELSKGMDKIGIHLSPIQLDYMIDSYSGGFLRQFRISGEELSDLPVIGDLMLRDPHYPKRQLNEYFSDWELLKQKKQSGIATREELRELNRIDGFYNTYKTISGNITKAKKANNQALVVKYSNLLRERLERYGY